jgi:transcriptional regulator with XRE-family HTH domain
MMSADAEKQDEEARAERRRDALRRLLTWRGWSVAECARNAGLINDSGRPSSALDNFLNGRARSLSAEALEAIADVFGVTVDVVLGRAPLPPVSGDIPGHGDPKMKDFSEGFGMPRDKTRVEIKIHDRVNIDTKVDQRDLDRVLSLIQMILSASIGKSDAKPKP